MRIGIKVLEKSTNKNQIIYNFDLSFLYLRVKIHVFYYRKKKEKDLKMKKI